MWGAGSSSLRTQTVGTMQVWGLGFGDWGLGLGFGFWGLGFGVWVLGFEVRGLGFFIMVLLIQNLQAWTAGLWR